MTDSSDTKTLDRIVQRLEGIGDDLRVRAHLAGMEAKDAWDRAHFERVTDELTFALDETKLQLHLAGLDAKEAWGKLSERLFELRGTTGDGLDTTVRATADALRDLLRSLGKSVETGTSERTTSERSRSE